MRWNGYASMNGTGKVVIDIADAIRRSSASIKDESIFIGEQLIRAKSLLPHGQWGSWLKAEFSWSERTAQRYMAVADKFSGKSDTVSDLSYTVLVELSANDVPQEAIDEAVEMAESGEKVTKSKAKAIADKHKPKKTRAKKSQEPTNRIKDELKKTYGAGAEEPSAGDSDEPEAIAPPVSKPAPVQSSALEQIRALLPQLSSEHKDQLISELVAEKTPEEREQLFVELNVQYGSREKPIAVMESLLPDDPADLKPPTKKHNTPEFCKAWRKWCDHNAKKGRPLTLAEAECDLQALCKGKVETAIKRINHTIQKRLPSLCLAKELPTDFEHPELSTVIGYAVAMKIPQEVADDFYTNYARQGWVLGNGQLMADWKQSLHHWAKNQKGHELGGDYVDPFMEPPTPLLPLPKRKEISA